MSESERQLDNEIILIVLSLDSLRTQVSQQAWWLVSSDAVYCFGSTESQNLPKQPPLMLALGQATECVQLMARVRSGSCSFARVDNFLH